MRVNVLKYLIESVFRSKSKGPQREMNYPCRHPLQFLLIFPTKNYSPCSLSNFPLEWREKAFSSSISTWYLISSNLCANCVPLISVFIAWSSSRETPSRLPDDCSYDIACICPDIQNLLLTISLTSILSNNRLFIFPLSISLYIPVPQKWTLKFSICRLRKAATLISLMRYCAL